MSYFEFTIPPIPHYLYSGEDTYSKGDKHPNRKNIQVFDLLFVTDGSLYIYEDNQEWTISSGECLMLRPDRHHYSSKPCDTQTHFYWLHFQTEGVWAETIDSRQPVGSKHITPFYLNERFVITIPRHVSLSYPIDTFEKIRKLIVLIAEPSIHSRWEEQTIFQEILHELHRSQTPLVHTSVMDIAEKSALYLQRNFDKKISNQTLSEKLNFHSGYISRCMKQVFGCTPLEYLVKYRIAQSKLLILNTNLSIGVIAEKTGFANSSYFTRCFVKEESMTPLQFRKKHVT
ncbi:helix-turn-helix domain-containing protein [Bacillus infantis]|uniref:helix-turn-helix domain-containing protein n=1 Tax=Bacillus infantis TaxID=324767 RepID=UPI00209CC27E|nr:AraC family transcriptional regulator [Bacillus infantis]MCP1160664.1 AraC family transcriptional regulator [Bacillus infantis]